MDMQEMLKVGKQIEKFYAEDKYTDIDGNVWLGIGDERWYMEGKEAEEDAQYWLTNDQMMKKMCSELTGDEQFRRDEVARREAQYEYAIKRTSIETGTSHIWYDKWLTKEQAEDDLSGYIEAEEIHEAEHGYRYATYSLVKRRKAGPVEDV